MARGMDGAGITGAGMDGAGMNQFFELLGGPAPALYNAQQPAEGPPLAAAGPLKQFLGPVHGAHG